MGRIFIGAMGSATVKNKANLDLNKVSESIAQTIIPDPTSTGF